MFNLSSTDGGADYKVLAQSLIFQLIHSEHEDTINIIMYDLIMMAYATK